MVQERTINEIEYLASHYWPAREIERYYGWIIQWQDGVTWRANSVLPLAATEDELVEDSIDYVIDFYDKRNIPPAFKMTEASIPIALDEILDEMDFQQRMITLFQTVPIEKLVCLDTEVEVDILRVSDETIDTLYHRSMRDEFAIQVRKEIIHRIKGEKKIARVMIDGQLAGVGLGVVEDDMMGIFSIRTMPEFRRRGVGWSINCALSIWGEENGADTAFLQVEADNNPALALYEKLGFKTLYTYWYRILEEPP